MIEPAGKAAAPPLSLFSVVVPARDEEGCIAAMVEHLHVELKLHKQWTTYAQSHRWHDSQKVEVAADHVIVRVHVRVCPELEAWILGFGEEAEVLAPGAPETSGSGVMSYAVDPDAAERLWDVSLELLGLD